MKQLSTLSVCFLHYNITDDVRIIYLVHDICIEIRNVKLDHIVQSSSTLMVA